MAINQTVENVFNGVSAVANGAQAMMSGITTGFTTFENLQQQQQQQNQFSNAFSRRNMQQMPQQYMQMYQAPQYPWADMQYTGYGFGNFQTPVSSGYPGISDPNYGKIGYIGTAPQMTQATSAWGSGIGTNGTMGGWQW